MTARVLVQLIGVLAVACCSETMPNILVEYPDPENYNMVTLSCRGSFGDFLDDAEFFKRVPEHSLVQLPGSIINGEITVNLTQAEEGYFSCSSASEGGTSSEIGLAGNL